MNWKRSILEWGAAFAALRSLFAYLDPGSGSLIGKFLIAMLVGIAATFRFWKARLLSLFGVKQEPIADDGEERETDGTSSG